MTAGIRSGTNNDGYIQVNGNDIITALSSGNVGIGNTSPSTKLQVNGTVTATNFAGNISGNTTISGDLTIPEKIIHTGDTGTFMKFNTDEIVFETGASSKVFINDAGDLTVGASEGNLGKLFIKQAADSDTEGLAFLNSGGGNSFRLFLGDSSGTVAHIGHGGQKQLNVTQAGNVGIGVAGPNRKFQVKSAGTNAVQMSLLDNDSSNEIWRVGQATDGDGYVEVLEDGGTVGCKLDASGNSFTMGNFGVGIASPAVKLHVDSGSSYSVGTFNSTHADGILINLQRSGSNKGFIGSGKNIAPSTGGADDVGMRAQSNLIFTAGGGTERLRILSDGRVLIGTNSGATSGSTNEALLTISGQASSATNPGHLNLWRNASINVNNELGKINFCGESGTGVPGATISAEADAEWNTSGDASDHPARLIFSTVPDGSSVAAERVRIDSNGMLHISDRNSGNAGDHVFQAGAFGIRMSDTGGYNRWNIERNYGGWQSTPVVHLTAQGRVGINTASPSWPLTVQGSSGTTTIGLKNTGGHSTLYVEASASNTAKINLFQAGTSGYSLQTGGTDALQFFRDSSEKIRMVSGGQLNIGGNFGQSEARLWVSDTTKTIAVGTVTIASTTSTGAADTGPVLRFYGHDGNTDRFHSSIKGAKENSTSGNYAGYITLNTRPNGSSMVERLRISSVGFTRFRCDTRFNREAYTRGGQIGEGGSTGNATGNDGTQNPGGFKFNFNTPVWGSNTHYKYWMQSGDNYPHASTFIEINIRNAFMYRVMIKGSHSSDTADIAMYMIYGLANNSGNQPPMVVRLDRNTGGNNNALESSSNDVSGTFSTSVQNYGSNANGSYDTTLRITYNGNNNQGLVAFIEEFGNE